MHKAKPKYWGTPVVPGSWLRMADGIHSVLIDPGVEGSVVHIPDYLSGSNLVVKVGGICASSKEDVARIHGFDDRKGLDKLSHARIRFLFLLPLTFPAGHDLVSQVLKTLKTFHGRWLDIGNTGHTHAKNNPRTRRLCCWFRRNHPPSWSTRDLVFALVASVLDTLPLVWKPVFLLQLMFLPQEPFQSGLGMIGDESPSLDGFGGDGVFLHAVEAIVMQTSCCNRHFVKWAKAALFAKLREKV